LIGEVPLFVRPLTPVRRIYIHQLLGFSIDPTAEEPAAWEFERGRAVLIDNGNLKVAPKWCGRNGLPHRNLPRRNAPI
jgi:hypothetical protein